MNNARWMDRVGATKGKLALIAVLAVILASVIGVQIANYSVTPIAERPTAPSQPSVTTRRGSASQPSRESSPPSAQPAEARAWPEMSMDDVVSNDPLAVPAWFETVAEADVPPDRENRAETEARLAALAEAQAQRQQQAALVLDDLRQKGARIVVLSEGEKVAYIGEQVVRIGDRIEQFEITDVTRSGVVLSEIIQP